MVTKLKKNKHTNGLMNDVGTPFESIVKFIDRINNAESEEDRLKNIRKMIKCNKDAIPETIKFNGADLIDLDYPARFRKNQKRIIAVLDADAVSRGKFAWRLETPDFFDYDDHGRRIPHIECMTITPEIAVQIFAKCNFRNRKVDMGKVKYYTQILLSGHWYVTHQGI